MTWAEYWTVAGWLLRNGHEEEGRDLVVSLTAAGAGPGWRARYQRDRMAEQLGIRRQVGDRPTPCAQCGATYRVDWDAVEGTRRCTFCRNNLDENLP